MVLKNSHRRIPWAGGALQYYDRPFSCRLDGICPSGTGMCAFGKEKGFVESARAIGCDDTHIVIRHKLPNVLSPVIVLATLGMGNIILSIAALGFLGLGAQPPLPEWGTMLNEGRTFMQTAPHLMIFPGLMIMIVVLAFNFLGDGLRDALDPRLSYVMMK